MNGHAHKPTSSDWFPRTRWASVAQHAAGRMRENCACGAYRWVEQPSFDRGSYREGPVTPWIGGIAA